MPAIVRGDPVVGEIGAELANLFFDRARLGLGGFQRIRGAMRLLLARRPRIEQRLCALRFLPGISDVDLPRRPYGFEARDSPLLRSRIDLHQQRAWPDAIAGSHSNPGEEALDLRLNDVRVFHEAVRKILYWGVANPNPYTQFKRHGRYEAVSLTSPSELYSNSTLALNVETGKLVWYFQELPGDDWDADDNQERVLVRTRVSPEPRFVKWINPALTAGTEQDVVITVAEGGGMFAVAQETRMPSAASST